MGEVAQSEKGPIYFMAPYRILVDAVGGGGSLWFHFKNKEAALHFAVAADAAKAGEILNEHFYEVLEAALANADAADRAECDRRRSACGHSPDGYGDLHCGAPDSVVVEEDRAIPFPLPKRRRTAKKCVECEAHDARRAAEALPPSGEPVQ